MAQCLIGLGSNLGDRGSILDAARVALDDGTHTRVVSRSRYHETIPIGGPAGQGAFLNGAVLVDTTLTPAELLKEAAKIERELGRQRVTRWGPRAIDLDLLLYDDLVIDSSSLQLPHPRMAWRRFVLVPAAEVAPAMEHPKIGWTIERLLNHLDTVRDYIAIAGPDGVGKRELAQATAAHFEGSVIADPVSFDCQQGGAKSYGIELETEIESAKRRANAIDVNASIWNEPSPLWVSDFWVGQSAAAIRAFVEESRREALLQEWSSVIRDVCPPKLTVVMDAPAAWCTSRLTDRGLPDPHEELSRTIDVIGEELRNQANLSGLGPVLAVDGQRPAEALEELVAAVLAMKSRTHHES